MNTKRGINFFALIILIVIGSKLYKHFDFKELKFEKPGIDTLYLITFVLLLFVVIRDLINRKHKKQD
ncbi:MAG: hypothetical protein RIQ89_2278 [Bacteroidota bacterium]|jgi:predicted tellurium resistance membrane protein TerC